MGAQSSNTKLKELRLGRKESGYCAHLSAPIMREGSTYRITKQAFVREREDKLDQSHSETLISNFRNTDVV